MQPFQFFRHAKRSVNRNDLIQNGVQVCLKFDVIAEISFTLKINLFNKLYN
jgi:hypothetical protein